MKKLIHPSAFVEEGAIIADGVNIWHLAQVRKGARLEEGVSIGKDVYIDADVTVGLGTRIQNGVNVYKGVGIGKYCFVGPGVTFTNDRYPRVGRTTWTVVPTILDDGCSLGAGAIVRCGVHIGAFAMVGSGAVVTKDIPAFCLVTGVPADATHRICACTDTVMPLISFDGQVIRDCCHKNLKPEVLQLAITKADEARDLVILPRRTGVG